MPNENNSSEINKLIEQDNPDSRRKGVLIFKLDVESEDFKEISYDKDLPPHKFLNHNRILLFVDPEHSRIYIWEGSNVTIRMKFLSAQLASKVRDQYGIDYSITTVDDGDETLDFKQFNIY